MERFRLKGIVSPGRVNLHGVGTVELASLSDEQAEKLWREGCPYLEPAAEYNRHNKNALELSAHKQSKTRKRNMII
jgi:hypothetical protein